MALFLILLIGTLLRLHNIAVGGLWLDEVIVLKTLRMNDIGQLLHWCASDNYPPLYFITLHFWFRLFGNSEFSAHLMSVAFSILAIFMTYKIGEILFEKRTAIIASFLIAISSFHVTNAKEIKMYSMTALIGLCSIYYFIKFIKRNTPGNMAGYIIITCLLIYTSYSGIFVILIQYISLLSLWLFSKERRKIDIKAWLISQGVVLLLFLPWLYSSILQFKKTVSGSASDIFALQAERYIMPLITFAGSDVSLLALAIASLFVVIKTYGAGHGSEDDIPYVSKIVFVLIWIFSPIVLLFCLRNIGLTLFSAKYVVIAAFAIYILAAHGMALIRSKWLRSVAITIVAVFSLLNLGAQNMLTVSKGRFREAAYYIDQNAKSGDLVLFQPGYLIDTVFDYYCNRKDIIKMSVPSSTRNVPITVKEKNYKITGKDLLEIDAIASNSGRVWFIKWNDQDTNSPIVYTLLRSHAMEFDRRYRDTELFFFTKKDMKLRDGR